MRRCFVLVLLLGVLFMKPAEGWSGKLDQFEDAATKDNPPSHHSSDEDSDDDDASLLQFLVDLFFGGDSSESNASSSSGTVNTESMKRENGSPIIPFVRLDIAHQWVEPDIDAVDKRLEIGLGPFAGEVRSTRFDESSPDDNLDILYIHGLLRIPITRYAECDLGIGSIFLDGNEKSDGASLTASIYVFPFKHLSFRFSPTLSMINGNSIEDMDVSMSVGYPYGAVRAGFRNIESSGETLNGPYAGFSFVF